VRDRYVERGYCHPAPDGRRTSFHHALDTTRVFVAHDAGQMVGTMTLTPSIHATLPSTSAWAFDASERRRRTGP